jgi:hypothetical protein
MEYPSGWQHSVGVPGEKLLGHNEYGGQIVDYPPPTSSFANDKLLANILTPQSSSGVSLNTTLAALPSLTASTTRSRSTDTGNRENQV